MLLFSCGNNGSKKSTETDILQDSTWQQMNAVETLRKKAAVSKERITELPLGFYFGMPEEKSERHLKVLLAGRNSYIFELNGGKYYEDIEPSYHNGKLFKLEISIYTKYIEGVDGGEYLSESERQQICNYFINKYKTYECVKYESGGIHYVWNKGNLIIEMDENIISLVYTDESVAYPIRERRYKEESEKEMKRIEAEVNRKVEERLAAESSNSSSSPVQSSSWDGSVSQVKSYLKNHLKDPDSYESIEWSVIKKSSNGYSVRHKYRAKNSFGGYVVENKVFYMDSDGNVIRVVDY